MHRFILRNTANDPRTLNLRRANPGKILERPVVGGIRLAPRGAKIVLIHEITELMLKDVERLSAMGNIEFLSVGKVGGVADLDAIRRVRKWDVPSRWIPYDSICPDTVDGALPTAEELAELPVPNEPLLTTPEELVQEATSEPEAPPEEPAASSVPAVLLGEAPSPEPDKAPSGPKYPLESVDELSLKALQALVQQEGGKTPGKSKETLRQFLMAL